MKPRRPLTPAQMRMRHHQRESAPLPPPDQSRRPPLAAETGAELDATAEWLAHLAAGRIEVR